MVYGGEMAEGLRLNRGHAEWLRDSGILGKAELSVPGVCDLANRYEGGPGGECQEHKQVWLAP